jgi:hypothetical protein
MKLDLAKRSMKQNAAIRLDQIIWPPTATEFTKSPPISLQRAASRHLGQTINNNIPAVMGCHELFTLRAQ